MRRIGGLRRTKERPTAEQMAQRKTDRMVEKLNLNEDQSKQLYELNLQEVKDMQAQHEADARRPQGPGREDAKDPHARAVRAVEADAGPEARYEARPADEGWKGMRLQGRQEM
ncbi:MAG: DUF4890 domain-containing protein [Alistipes onderdonkii]